MFEEFCPNFIDGHNGNFTSSQTPLYNCIAFSLRNELTYIWPDRFEVYAWPPHLPRGATIGNFVSFYELCGFWRVADGNPVHGLEKIVIYTLEGEVSHAARLRPDGMWTCKVGDLADISHVDPNAAGGGKNGTPTIFMARKDDGRPPRLPALHPPLSTLVSSGGTPLADLA